MHPTPHTAGAYTLCGKKTPSPLGSSGEKASFLQATVLVITFKNTDGDNCLKLSGVSSGFQTSRVIFSTSRMTLPIFSWKFLILRKFDPLSKILVVKLGPSENLKGQNPNPGSFRIPNFPLTYQWWMSLQPLHELVQYSSGWFLHFSPISLIRL